MPKSLSKIRNTAFLRQDGRCYYCDRRMWLPEPGQSQKNLKSGKGACKHFQCTAEHLVARQDGGSDSADNIVAACYFCNSRRHHCASPKTSSAHRKHVQGRLAKGKWHPHHLRSQAGQGIDP